jgi:hypothetical protein
VKESEAAVITSPLSKRTSRKVCLLINRLLRFQRLGNQRGLRKAKELWPKSHVLQNSKNKQKQLKYTKSPKEQQQQQPALVSTADEDSADCLQPFRSDL